MNSQPREMDITALLHADIRKRDWDRMHVRADRRLPAPLGDAAVRCRGGRPIVVRPWMAERV